MSGRQEHDQKLEQWIEEKLKNQPSILEDYMISIENKTSPTRKAYLGYLIQYINFVLEHNLKITEVKPMHIDRYIKFISNGNGPCIVNAKLAAVTSFYDFLEENDFVTKNPCSNKERLKIKKKPVVYMTVKEVKKIKRNVVSNSRKGIRNNCIIILGCTTGLRASALVNIDIEDIDFDSKTITVIEKGNNERTVFLVDEAIEAINKWLQERYKKTGNNTGPLFTSNNSNRLSVRAMEEMIQKASQDLDKNITPHKMRSTCGMHTYIKTGDIKLAADVLGHADLRSINRYAESTDKRQREIVNELGKMFAT